MLKLTYFLLWDYNKGEGHFSFTFLRREISPATLSAAFTAFISSDMNVSYFNSLPVTPEKANNLCTFEIKLNMQQGFFRH
jgi:hypothetical protein